MSEQTSLRAAAEIAAKLRRQIERQLPACASNFVATAILTGMVDAATEIEHDIHVLAHKAEGSS